MVGFGGYMAPGGHKKDYLSEVFLLSFSFILTRCGLLLDSGDVCFFFFFLPLYILLGFYFLAKSAD